MKKQTFQVIRIKQLNSFFKLFLKLLELNK